MPEEHKRIYLGDSVYAEVENGMLLLTTNNGYPDDPRNKIYLEAEAIIALEAFIAHIRKE
jgi:hypothetical protein